MKLSAALMIASSLILIACSLWKGALFFVSIRSPELLKADTIYPFYVCEFGDMLALLGNDQIEAIAKRIKNIFALKNKALIIHATDGSNGV